MEIAKKPFLSTKNQHIYYGDLFNKCTALDKKSSFITFFLTKYIHVFQLSVADMDDQCVLLQTHAHT